ncbi:MAG: SGNH/GDSL hydrolase family protein [Polyangiaceae bacterium]
MSWIFRSLAGAAIASAGLIVACSEREAPKPPPALTVATNSEAPGDAALDASEDDPTSPSDAGAPAKLRHHNRSVLHLGDSMVGFRGGLTLALEHRFQDGGTRFYSSSITSAGIASFDESDHMEKLLARLNPEMVIISLGMNNVTYPHPEVLRHNIVSIVKKIAPRDCFWIGPPSWKPDAALVKVLAESTAPCTFFDSTDLTLERQTDGVHPTERGGETWAEAFWLFYLAH